MDFLIGSVISMTSDRFEIVVVSRESKEVWKGIGWGVVVKAIYPVGMETEVQPMVFCPDHRDQVEPIQEHGNAHFPNQGWSWSIVIRSRV